MNKLINTTLCSIAALFCTATVNAEEYRLKCGISNFSSDEPFQLSWLEEDLCEDLKQCGTNADIEELSRYIDEISRLEETVTTLRRSNASSKNEVRRLKKQIVSLKAKIVVLKRRIK